MKNLVNSERRLVKKFFRNDNFLRIFSLVIAILFYVTINGVSSVWSELFLTSSYINSVPVNVIYDDEEYVITGLVSEVNVKVTGSKTNVESVLKQKNTITATLEIPTTEEGDKEINPNNFKFNYNGNVKFEPIVSSFTVSVQKKVTKSFPIELTYVNGASLTEGYLLSTPELSMQSVEITGGSQDIGAVDRVNALVDLDFINELKDGETEIVVPGKLVAYDKNGEVLTVKMKFSEISVTQPIKKETRQLPVEYIFTNNNTSNYVSSACDSAEIVQCEKAESNSLEYKETVQVFGDLEEIDKLTKVQYKIDMHNMNSTEEELEATAILPNGVYVTNATKKVVVKTEPGTTKTIENIPVRITGLDSTLSVKAKDETNALVTIKITGAASVVNEITNSDVNLYVDLSSVTTTGEIQVPINYKVNEYVTVELLTERATLIVSEAQS